MQQQTRTGQKPEPQIDRDGCISVSFMDGAPVIDASASGASRLERLIHQAVQRAMTQEARQPQRTPRENYRCDCPPGSLVRFVTGAAPLAENETLPLGRVRVKGTDKPGVYLVVKLIAPGEGEPEISIPAAPAKPVAPAPAPADFAELAAPKRAAPAPDTAAPAPPAPAPGAKAAALSSKKPAPAAAVPPKKAVTLAKASSKIEATPAQEEALRWLLQDKDRRLMDERRQQVASGKIAVKPGEEAPPTWAAAMLKLVEAQAKKPGNEQRLPAAECLDAALDPHKPADAKRREALLNFCAEISRGAGRLGWGQSGLRKRKCRAVKPFADQLLKRFGAASQEETVGFSGKTLTLKQVLERLDPSKPRAIRLQAIAQMEQVVRGEIAARRKDPEKRTPAHAAALCQALDKASEVALHELEGKESQTRRQSLAGLKERARQDIPTAAKKK